MDFFYQFNELRCRIFNFVGILFTPRLYKLGAFFTPLEKPCTKWQKWFNSYDTNFTWIFVHHRYMPIQSLFVAKRFVTKVADKTFNFVMNNPNMLIQTGFAPKLFLAHSTWLKISLHAFSVSFLNIFILNLVRVIY